MKKYLTEYRAYIKSLLSQDEIKDSEKVLRYHEEQIKFFSHERLVHLIITLFFALLLFATVFVSIITASIKLTIIALLLLCLVIPYIMHYYFLENNVQGLYDDYNRLYEKCYGISYKSNIYHGSLNE